MHLAILLGWSNHWWDRGWWCWRWIPTRGLGGCSNWLHVESGVSNFKNAWESMDDEDEYQLEDLEVVAADYMLKVVVSNFRNAWESMGDEWQQIDNSEMHGKAWVMNDCKLIMLFTNNWIMPNQWIRQFCYKWLLYLLLLIWS